MADEFAAITRLRAKTSTDLSRPYNAEAVGFVVGDAWSADGGSLTHATAVPYLTASAVIARLNHVCPGRWSQTFRRSDGHMWCDLVIDGIVFSDIGDVYTGKALLSDARVRAAWAAGVGAFLRAVPAFEMTGAHSLKPWRINGEPWLKLTRAGERRARLAYATWLAGVGQAAFGDAIDHGNLTVPSNGEGPPMPVLRPGEKRDTPAKRGRQAPQPIVTTTSGAGCVVRDIDPEALAEAELAKLLASNDGLGTLRDVLDKTMIAQGVELASERLQTIVDAGDKRGLDAALLNLSRVEKVEQGPIEHEGETTT